MSFVKKYQLLVFTLKSLIKKVDNKSSDFFFSINFFSFSNPHSISHDTTEQASDIDLYSSIQFILLSSHTHNYHFIQPDCLPLYAVLNFKMCSTCFLSTSARTHERHINIIVCFCCSSYQRSSLAFWNV